MSTPIHHHPRFEPRSVAIVGCGGTGSWLLEPLARLLAYHRSAAGFRANERFNLLLCDGDRWESRNAERQLCTEEDVGKSKAATFERKLLALGLPGVRPWVVEEMLRDVEDVERVLRTSSGPLLVVACVDNDVARATLLRWLDEFCDDDWAFVTPGNALGEVKGQVRVDGRVRGHHIAAPLLSRSEYAEPDRSTGITHCAAAVPERPQLLVANVMAAALTLHAIHRLLDGGDYYQETFFLEHPRDGFKVTTDGDRLPAARLGGAP